MINSSRKIGIEIENESLSVSLDDVHYQLQNSKHWEAEADGSLRGAYMGWEIKSRGLGVPFNECILALNELYPVLSECSGVWRAAIHVHVDATDLSPEEKALALCLGYVYDDGIFDAVSPERRESNFCVPLAQKARNVFSTIESLIFSEGAGEYDYYGKYSSINAESLRRFGTFEFRHMRTPATDNTVPSIQQALGEITTFASIACAIVDSVRHYRVVSRLYGGQLSVPMLVAKTLLMVLDAQSGTLGGQRIKVDQEALFDILTTLHTLSDDQVQRVNLDLDAGSLMLCVPQRIRRMHRPEPRIEYPDIIDRGDDAEEYAETMAQHELIMDRLRARARANQQQNEEVA